MNKEEIRKRVLEEPTYVNAKRFDNDLASLEERYPDGCPDHVIAQALVLSVHEVHKEDEQITAKMRGLMGVEK